MDVTTPLDNLGAAAVGIAAIAFVVLMTLWGVRTEARKSASPSRSTEWKAPRSWESHREWLGGLSIPKAADAQVERVRNELRRHCRIGKIILK